MNKKEKIKTKIQKLINEKNDVQFEISKILDYFIAIIIGWATVSVTVVISIKDILVKTISGIGLIIFIFVIYFIFFKRMTLDKGEKLNNIKNELDCEYSKLLEE